MQYHLNGFMPGNPEIRFKPDAPVPDRSKVDVAIIGCGPAGLTLAAQLAVAGGISVRIFDRKTGPLEVGQADGIACRSMEMFEAFGFVDRVRKESYWVNETTFWRPDGEGRSLRRVDRIQDVEDDLSHQPHVILSQARVHDFYLELMRHSPARLKPDYARALTDLRRTVDPDHPVTAVFDCVDAPGTQETVQAKFIVGCDGARSTVRSLMGRQLKGEAGQRLWGVMDVLAVSDFPDIRLKCAIQSSDAGSLLIIPREGGFLVRLYIELDALGTNERAADRNVSPEMLAQKAADILHPYKFEVKDVAWWSAYEIGQRLCDTFDDITGSGEADAVPRLFIAGDACHTHSPKAGQGMNVSMADTFNLGWKLGQVLRGWADPALLRTYSEERQAKASELIAFDKEMARLFSQKPETEQEKAQFQQYFKKHGRYTAGVETTYGPSLITGEGRHQHLAVGLEVGKRFHSAPVIRLADAKPMQLAETLLADMRWRLIAFADRTDQGLPGGAIAELCAYLQKDQKTVLCRPHEGEDAMIDLCAVFQQGHRTLDVSGMPDLLLPRRGRFELIDYEKTFTADLKNGADIFDIRGIDREKGALVLVRPDQFIADVLPLGAREEITAFFARFTR